MAASEDTAAATGARRQGASWRRGANDTRYAAGMVAALAYYYLVPNPLLALPGLAAFAALAWLRLELALCLLPLTFPFWYVPKRAWGQAVFPLSEIALAACLAVAIGRLLFAGIRVTRNAEDAKLHATRALRSLLHPAWRWLLIGATLLLVGTAAGVLVAVRPREALRAFRWDVAEPLLYAGLLTVCLWRRTGSDDAGARGGGRLTGGLIVWLAAPVVALGALFGMLAIVQVLWLHATFTPLAAGNHLVAVPTQTGGPPVRATGIFYGSPNSLGALLERILPLALALLLWRVLRGVTGNAEHAENRRDRRDRREEKETHEVAAGNPAGTSAIPSPETPSASEMDHPLSASSPSSDASVSSVVKSPSATWGEGVALGGCVLVMAVGLALTGSRGAQVGAAVGLLVVLLAHPRARRVALGIVVLCVAVALWQGNALLQAALVGHGESGEVRLLLWQSALRMIRDHPLLGIGPDQFLYYYDPAYSAHPYWIPRIGGHLTAAASQPNLAHPHNLILDLWLSGGVLGLAGFALVVGWLAWICWRVWRANRRTVGGRWPVETALVVGACGGVLAGLTHGMVDSAYFQPDLALLFWWAVAAVFLVRTQTATPMASAQKLTGAARRSGSETSDQNQFSGSYRS